MPNGKGVSAILVVCLRRLVSHHFLVDTSANFTAGLIKVFDAVLSLQERPMPSEPVKNSSTRPSG